MFQFFSIIFFYSSRWIDFCTGDTCGFNDHASYYGLGGLANGLYLLLLLKSNV